MQEILKNTDNLRGLGVNESYVHREISLSSFEFFGKDFNGTEYHNLFFLNLKSIEKWKGPFPAIVHFLFIV